MREGTRKYFKKISTHLIKVTNITIHKSQQSLSMMSSIKTHTLSREKDFVKDFLTLEWGRGRSSRKKEGK